MLKVKRLILIFALLFSNLTITLFADTNQRITDIRFWQSPEEAQVVLDLSEPPKACMKASSHPSPPSLTGTEMTEASGNICSRTSFTARFASSDDMQSLKESIATMIFMVAVV